MVHGYVEQTEIKTAQQYYWSICKLHIALSAHILSLLTATGNYD